MLCRVVPGRKQYKLWLPGPVAQRIRHLTTNQGIAGSSPARVKKFSSSTLNILFWMKNYAPPGGLEPPTFRLTAERASRLRHGGKLLYPGQNISAQIEQCKMSSAFSELPWQTSIRYGLVVRIPGSHPGGPGSIPGNGISFLPKSSDEDGIRTHAGRAHWISSPTP